MMKDFLSFAMYSRSDLDDIFALAEWLKEEHPKHFKPLRDKTAAVIFEKPSLRTHVSFEVGILQLGGQSVYLSGSNIGISTRESVKDVAEVLSQYNDLIVIRTFKHEVVEQLAQHATIPVINALTDLLHPCQVLADAFTLRERGMFTDSTKVVFIGDGNNMVNSWLELAEKMPFHFVLACPTGYEPDQNILARAIKAGVSKIEIVRDPREAAEGADVLYTDVWVSMGQEAERAERLEVFKKYQINEGLLALAHPGCVVMHCLPAHRGEEITANVLEGPHSIILPQAQNRLHVQKGILAYLFGARKPVAVGHAELSEPILV
jgi:ornithine carbamoyltransferase